MQTLLNVARTIFTIDNIYFTIQSSSNRWIENFRNIFWAFCGTFDVFNCFNVFLHSQHFTFFYWRFVLKIFVGFQIRLCSNQNNWSSWVVTTNFRHPIVDNRLERGSTNERKTNQKNIAFAIWSRPKKFVIRGWCCVNNV